MFRIQFKFPLRNSQFYSHSQRLQNGEFMCSASHHSLSPAALTLHPSLRERDRERMGQGGSSSRSGSSSMERSSSSHSHRARLRQKLRRIRRRCSFTSKHATSPTAFKLVSADDFAGIALLTLISVRSLSLSLALTLLWSDNCWCRLVGLICRRRWNSRTDG